MSVEPSRRSTLPVSHARALIVLNRQRTKKINPPRFRQLIQALLEELELERVELGVHLVGTPEMTRLNETFLRHAGSTDVITFDYGDGAWPASGRTAPSTAPTPKSVHGEIFICVDEAVRQARRFGVTWQLEVARYVIHGLLHLIGFDDGTIAKRRRMKREENRCLRRLSRRFSLAQLAGPGRIPA